MSEWTAEQVRSVVAAVRNSGFICGIWMELCAIADAYAARLETDAQPVDDAAVREAVEHLSRVSAMEMVGGYEKTIQGAQSLYAAYRTACRERDEARADVERLRARVKELEQVCAEDNISDGHGCPNCGQFTSVPRELCEGCQAAEDAAFERLKEEGERHEQVR